MPRTTYPEDTGPERSYERAGYERAGYETRQPGRGGNGQRPSRGESGRYRRVAEAVEAPMRQAADAAQDNIQRVTDAFGAAWLEMVDTGQPMAGQIARANMELLGLAARRGQAMAELPSRLATCRSPQHLIVEQMHFVRELLSDYHATSTRLIDMGATVAEIASERQQEMGRRLQRAAAPESRG